MWLTMRSRDGEAKVLEVPGNRLVIGREEGCDVLLEDDKASRRHAALSTDEQGRVVVEDLGSTNGTYVNDRRIAEPTILAAGDRLRIGETEIAASLTEPRPAAPPTALETPLPAPPAADVAAAAPVPPAEPAAPPPSPPSQPPPPPAAPAEPAPPTPSRIERLMLRRSVRRAQIVAGVAGAGVVVAIVIAVLFVTGAIGGEEEPPSVPEIIEAVKSSTVQIRGTEEGNSFGLGTGWVLDATEGLIVTNSHVTNEATEFTVRVGDEREEREAELVGVAPCEDLAVLRVSDTAGLTTMKLGTQAELRQGESVIALGYPTSLATEDPLIATEGVVSVVRTVATFGGGIRYRNAVQTDAVINPGNSGGPLVNLEQELVGVNTFKSVAQGVEGQFYAIGVDRVKLITGQLRAGRSLGYNGMGFFYPQDGAQLAELGLPEIPGLVVARAVPGTPAAEAGFGQGPVLIVAVNGVPIDTTIGSWCGAVGDHQQGETATFTVFVPGAAEPQDVTLEFA